MSKKISLDPGHGWGKFYDGEQKIKIESVLGEPKRSLNGSHQSIEWEGGHYLVGESARKQSDKPIIGVDESWPLSPQYRALIYYGIAQMVSEDQRQVTVSVGSTLAIRDYKRNLREIIDLLSGEVQVYIDNKQELKIIIKEVNMFPQCIAPAGVYRDGESYVAAVDFGTRNTNYATIDGNDIVFAKTDSSENGAIRLLESVKQRIADDYGLEYHPIDLIERNVIQTGMIRVGAERINITPIIERETQAYYESFRSLVSSVWGNANKINRLVVFGGGDMLIGSMIARDFGQAIRLPDPQWAQAKQIYQQIA